MRRRSFHSFLLEPPKFVHPRVDPANREMAAPVADALATPFIWINVDCSFVDIPTELAQFGFRIVQQLLELGGWQRSFHLGTGLSVRISLVRKLVSLLGAAIIQVV